MLSHLTVHIEVDGAHACMHAHVCCVGVLHFISFTSTMLQLHTLQHISSYLWEVIILHLVNVRQESNFL